MKITRITAAFEQAARNFQSLCSTSYPETIQRAIDLLVERLSSGGKLLACGNGGSAADAMHICAELVGRFLLDRRPLPAIALNTDQTILTALANDFGYETVFLRQVEALAKPEDVVWGISTSGNSMNVVAALKAARSLGAATIGLTGAGGGAMAEYCDILLAAPHTETPRIQEIHVITYHIICEAVEAAICGAADSLAGNTQIAEAKLL